MMLFALTTRATIALMRSRCIRGSLAAADSTTVVMAADETIGNFTGVVKGVSELRKEYSLKGISDEDMDNINDPVEFFASWFAEACKATILEPNAMCLSTCHDNKPSSRMVLMKEFDRRGVAWYTNYNSRKSNELLSNPHAATTFWWGELERSVRIEGAVERVAEEESDRYFSSRPRSSQIGAWSSCQSSEVTSRIELEQQQRDVEHRFRDPLVPVPRPPHWGGFRLIPVRVEFWKGRESRMHDRIVFDRTASVGGSQWYKKRLQP